MERLEAGTSSGIDVHDRPRRHDEVRNRFEEPLDGDSLSETLTHGTGSSYWKQAWNQGDG